MDKGRFNGGGPNEPRPRKSEVFLAETAYNRAIVDKKFAELRLVYGQKSIVGMRVVLPNDPAVYVIDAMLDEDQGKVRLRKEKEGRTLKSDFKITFLEPAPTLAPTTKKKKR
ncbi:MAG: hypothetical protein EXS55_04635 [Candidatus Magasanikbacteria bacterium]|nr:hypothetical protein [Candidatus Magasanikbacteria bacterium]